jgi:hypothetical protein
MNKSLLRWRNIVSLGGFGLGAPLALLWCP